MSIGPTQHPKLLRICESIANCCSHGTLLHSSFQSSLFATLAVHMEPFSISAFKVRMLCRYRFLTVQFQFRKCNKKSKQTYIYIYIYIYGCRYRYVHVFSSFLEKRIGNLQWPMRNVVRQFQRHKAVARRTDPP